MDCRVVVEAAVPVYDVETGDEAVRIAISKTGEMLNPDLNYVEINMGERSCPHCGDSQEPAFIAADEGLVALELEMTVFNVERDEHAARIARKEIGQRLQNIPLEVLEVEVVAEDEEEEEEGEDAPADESNESEESTAAAESIPSEEASGDDVQGNGDELDADPERDDEGDVLPEFEDLIDEG